VGSSQDQKLKLSKNVLPDQVSVRYQDEVLVGEAEVPAREEVEDEDDEREWAVVEVEDVGLAWLSLAMMPDAVDDAEARSEEEEVEEPIDEEYDAFSGRATEDAVEPVLFEYTSQPVVALFLRTNRLPFLPDLAAELG
jgi:hypothetical protein